MRRSTGALSCASAGRAASAVVSARMKRRRFLMAFCIDDWWLAVSSSLRAKRSNPSRRMKKDGAYAPRNDGLVKAMPLAGLPARHERLEGGHRFLGAQA